MIKMSLQEAVNKRSGNVMKLVKKYLMLAFSLVMIFGMSVKDACAIKLVSGSAVTQIEGTTLVVLTFDEPVDATLAAPASRNIQLNVPGLEISSPVLHKTGIVNRYYISPGRIVIELSRYVKAEMIPAETGKLVLMLRPANEPPPPPKPIEIEQPIIEQSEPDLSETIVEEPVKEYEFQEELSPVNLSSEGIEESAKNEVPVDVQENVNKAELPGDNSGEVEPEAIDETSGELVDVELPERIDVQRQIEDPSRIVLKNAEDLISLGSFDAALDILIQVKKSSSVFGESRIMAGDLYFKLTQYEEAEAAYLEAKEDPGSVEIATIKLALTYKNLGDKAKTVESWESVLAQAGNTRTTIDDDVPGISDTPVETATPVQEKFRSIMPFVFAGIIAAFVIIIVILIIRSRAKMNRMFEEASGEESEEELRPLSERIPSESEPKKERKVVPIKRKEEEKKPAEKEEPILDEEQDDGSKLDEVPPTPPSNLELQKELANWNAAQEEAEKEKQAAVKPEEEKKEELPDEEIDAKVVVNETESELDRELEALDFENTGKNESENNGKKSKPDEKMEVIDTGKVSWDEKATQEPQPEGGEDQKKQEITNEAAIKEKRKRASRVGGKRPSNWDAIESLQEEGMEVRDIAATLGLGQDEVRTAIQLLAEKEAT